MNFCAERFSDLSNTKASGNAETVDVDVGQTAEHGLDFAVWNIQLSLLIIDSLLYKRNELFCESYL